MSNFAHALTQFIRKRSILVPLMALQLVQIVLVPPENFPCNDDWMYSDMVSTLVHEHRYEHHPLVQPTSVAHVAIGALFVKAFGEGYATLRAATFVLGLIGAWAAAQCAIACGLPRRGALLVGTVVLVNPLYVNLSNTFMTDVPFMTLLSLSAFFFLMALRTEKASHVFMGGVVGVAAFFIRQFGVVPAAAYALVVTIVCIQRRQKPKSDVVTAFVVPWIAAAFGYSLWQNSKHDVLVRIFAPAPDQLGARAINFFSYVVVIVTLMGVYLLPVAAARASNLISRRERWPVQRYAAVVAYASAFGAVFVFHLKKGMPQPGNILHTFGIGPHTIDGQIEVGASALTAIAIVWAAVTVLGVLSASILIAGHTAIPRPKRAYPIRPMHELYLAVWAVLVFFSSYTSFTSDPFDRYTMPMIAPLAILGCGWIARGSARRALWPALASAALVYACSIAGVQDYQAWNRARWDAANYLLHEMKIPHESIDGGFEYNGEYNFHDWIKKFRAKNLPAGPSVQWGGLHNDPYKIAFSPVSGYHTIKAFSYFSWLGMTSGHVYALERDPAK